VLFWAVPWLRRLVAGLSPWSPGFASGSVHVGFVLNKVAMGQDFILVLRLFPLSISFHRRSPHTYVTWEMNNMSVGGSSSET
jgi:hypothetical protein